MKTFDDATQKCCLCAVCTYFYVLCLSVAYFIQLFLIAFPLFSFRCHLNQEKQSFLHTHNAKIVYCYLKSNSCGRFISFYDRNLMCNVQNVSFYADSAINPITVLLSFLRFSNCLYSDTLVFIAIRQIKSIQLHNSQLKVSFHQQSLAYLASVFHFSHFLNANGILKHFNHF